MDTNALIESAWPPDERENLAITTIKGDASNRQYFRVTGRSGTRIACIDPAFRGSNPATYPFLVVGRLLDGSGIRVPQVFDMDASKGILILEDCGNLMLQDEIGTLDAHGLEKRYREIIDILVRLQAIRPDGSPVPFGLAFDHEKLMFEFDFFITHGINGLFRGILEEHAVAELRDAFDSIARLLVLPEHFVLNHRDFHCRNIMLFRDEPVVIDFQDARLGLPQYDAASILRDSYTRLDRELVEKLKRYHFSELRARGITSMDLDEYLRLFDLVAFQRNVKAIGTFCYQTMVAGNRSFEQSIAPTLGYLEEYIRARPELSAAGRLLEPLIRSCAT